MNDTQVMARQTRESAADDTGLSIVSIAKSYDRRVVLSDVSLSVGRGEVVGLLGPNGAGKTQGDVDARRPRNVLVDGVASNGNRIGPMLGDGGDPGAAPRGHADVGGDGVLTQV